MFYGLGMQELLVILVIAMLLFGGKKLPEVGRNLGKAIRGFKEAEEETKKELKAAAEESSTPQQDSGQGEAADEVKGDEAKEGKDSQETEQDKVENEKRGDEAT